MTGIYFALQQSYARCSELLGERRSITAAPRIAHIHLAGSSVSTPSIRHVLLWARNRLSARADTEHEQAIIRIVIVAAVLLYLVAADAGPGASRTGLSLAVTIAEGDLLFAFAILGHILAVPEKSPPRRIIATVVDTSAVTAGLLLAGEQGAIVFVVFLLVILGMGFRFGQAYLFLSYALSLAGICIVAVFSDYWRQHRPIGISLAMAVIVVPLYFATLLKRLQEALLKAKEVSHAKSVFLVNISHELRTPLQGILGYSELLKEDLIDTEQYEFAEGIKESGEHLLRLVNTVLDLDKIEAGRLPIELREERVAEIMDRVTYGHKAAAERKNLKFELRIDSNTPATLFCDATKLLQVLNNLAHNAIKFTEQGEVSISVYPLGDQIVFETKDSGPGIPLALQSQIFEKFFQADPSSERAHEGTGLGLSLVRDLVSLMEGEIFVESNSGRGATFSVALPIRARP